MFLRRFLFLNGLLIVFFWVNAQDSVFVTSGYEELDRIRLEVAKEPTSRDNFELRALKWNTIDRNGGEPQVYAEEQMARLAKAVDMGFALLDSVQNVFETHPTVIIESAAQNEVDAAGQPEIPWTHYKGNPGPTKDIVFVDKATGEIAQNLSAGAYVFSVKGTKTYLNDKEILVAGLRCSNALYSKKSTHELIKHLNEYKSYGINTIGVYVMGSRYGNFKGYLEDGSMNPLYSKRLAKIIKAADKRGMIVLVGCLYWGGSTALWDSWTQKEANTAIANTVKFLKENNFRNVFVDVDNEGMAKRAKGFDTAGMVRAAKAVDSTFFIATNFHGLPPAEADLGIHFSEKDPVKPYIQSEGVPTKVKYWGAYSKAPPLENYINIGIYSDEMKANQIEITKNHFEKGWGYMCASTWLQCVAPWGPNADPGGDGSQENPGIRWWLEALKEMRGEYVAE